MPADCEQKQSACARRPKAEEPAKSEKQTFIAPNLTASETNGRPLTPDLRAVREGSAGCQG